MANDIRAARASLGQTRAAVAARAGVSSDTVRRCERGDPHVQLDVLCSIGEAVGLDVVIRVYPGRRSSLRDSGQVAIASNLSHQAHPTWRTAIEVAAGEHGEAVDLCLFGPTEILGVEIDRLILDFQDQYRRNARKREFLADRHQRPVRLVMAVQDTVRNRHAVQEHFSFIRNVLPAGSREILAAVRRGNTLGRDGLLWVRMPRQASVGRPSTLNESAQR